MTNKARVTSSKKMPCCLILWLRFLGILSKQNGKISYIIKREKREELPWVGIQVIVHLLPPVRFLITYISFSVNRELFVYRYMEQDTVRLGPSGKEGTPTDLKIAWILEEELKT